LDPSLKRFFDLLHCNVQHDGKRNVYRFVLKLSDQQDLSSDQIASELTHTRLIPSEVKKEVWKRDRGKCVLCSETKNLHFDHDLPFSKGGTSLTGGNVRLLCMKHNLQSLRTSSEARSTAAPREARSTVSR